MNYIRDNTVEQVRAVVYSDQDVTILTPTLRYNAVDNRLEPHRR